MQKQPFQVSLKQIAEAAGVSLATVSMVLRGVDSSSEATRRRVRQAAERLRYRPNLLVRGLQKGRTLTVGVVVPVVGYSSNIADGICQTLAAAGTLPIFHYQTDMLAPDALAKELAIIHRLLDQRVDGIILFPADESVTDLYYHEIWERGIPLVAVDRPLGLTRADFVGTDDKQGGRLAAEHLLGLGHHRVAEVAGSRTVATYSARREAFYKTVTAAGRTCQVVEFADPDYADADQRLLTLDPMPTAVFLATDWLAPALYRAAQAKGLRIPQDLSVVGFADMEWTQYLNPPLTTLRQMPATIGQNAAKILLDRIEGKLDSAKPVEIRLTPQLIVRASTAPPRQMT